MDYPFSSKEMNMMDTFMKTYGHPDAMPMERYLQHWYDAKSAYLLPMFNNQLIISENVEYREPDGILYDRIEEMFNNADWRACRNWLCDILDCVLFKGTTWRAVNAAWCSWDEEKELFEAYKLQYGIRMSIKDILYNSRCFGHNKVLDTYITIMYNAVDEIVLKPNEKNYLTKAFVLRVGQKPFRLIHSIINLWPIANSIDPEKFTYANKAKYTNLIEEFRLAHSAALNTKLLKGELCISIHPMDYLTASDNASNWSSCMTWTRSGSPGEFRNGVIEMMHSPMVVVAYLNNNKKPFHPLYAAGDNETEWNNKMWREFFIVDQGYIMAIKGYPYQCSALEDIVMNKLADMAEANGWSPYHREVHEAEYENFTLSNGIEVDLETGFMYNDTIDNTTRYIESTNPIWADGYYSGQMYCIVCDKPMYKDNDDENNDESIPYCSSCDPDWRCDICGGYIKPYPGEYFMVNGQRVCSDCVFRCAGCDEYSLYSDMTIVYAVYQDSELNRANSRTAALCPECFEKYQDYLVSIDTNNAFHDGDYQCLMYDPDQVWIIRPDAPDELLKLFYKPYRGELARENILDLTQYATKILT